MYMTLSSFLKILCIQRTCHQWLNESYVVSRTLNAFGDVVCKIATVVVAVSLVLNFKQFVIFVSDNKFN